MSLKLKRIYDPKKWEKFKRRYFQELRNQDELLEELASRSRQQTVTLLFAAKDTQHNNAIALKKYIQKKAELT